ncbi:MAG: serine protease [Phycisphaerae bacterium]|nr:serine protease [Phycisphaerae bacterium]
MSREERRQISDECLCNAYNFRRAWVGSEQPEIVAEVMRRGLDCSAAGQARRILQENPQPTVTPERSYGSGFAVSAEGHIVTAYHVVERKKAIKVHLSKTSLVSARILYSDSVNDLAVLKIESSTPNFLQLAPMRSVRIGDRVFTMGFPVSSVLGESPKYTEGVVSSLTGAKGAVPFLQITVPVQPGNSGGPLVDEKGEVVGIITSTAAILAFVKESGTLPQNVNWAVKADYLRPMVELPKVEQKQLSREQVIAHVNKSIFLIDAE